MIPIGTDNELRGTPLVNYSLIILNVVIYLLTHAPMDPMDSAVSFDTLREPARILKLDPEEPLIFQFVTCTFLHANLLHIIGNMFFLYVFGNNVNDKLGNLGYLLLYLGGGVFSSLGHALFNSSPVIGASGAVAAITGAYMVLFPQTRIHVLYFFIFIGTFDVPAMYFILFKLIVYDNVIFPSMSPGVSNVAHGAHMAGYLFGIGIPLILLALKILPHSHFDLWALIDRWHRRKQYRSMVNKGYNAFGPDQVITKKVDVKVKNSALTDTQEEHIIELRAEISQAITNANLDEAVNKYLELITIRRQEVLPQQQQLDVANKLMQMGRHEEAALAYHTFLTHYERLYPFTEQIHLMLGLIYSRYLNQRQYALKHLKEAIEKLTDPGQKNMCQAELDHLKTPDF
ncbi:MAG: rhomboid family intramembrane serine protease [Sedimentisphaerales bacterium]|nr:rhomboid family intramembrane serine protease [Sedimentisphaerales bacterium]